MSLEAAGLHLSVGLIAVIEPEEFGPQGWRRLPVVTGVVDSDDELILAVASGTVTDGSDVMVTIFAPDALYRVRGEAHSVTAGRVAIGLLRDLERIHRRRWPRHELNLDVTLAPVIAQGDPSGGIIACGVGGRTLDIGMGGLRVDTADRAPPATTLNVTLTLPDGAPLVARATVIATVNRDGRYESRLKFDQLDDVDIANLTALLDPHATAADIRRKVADGH